MAALGPVFLLSFARSEKVRNENKNTTSDTSSNTFSFCWLLVGAAPFPRFLGSGRMRRVLQAFSWKAGGIVEFAAFGATSHQNGHK